MSVSFPKMFKNTYILYSIINKFVYVYFIKNFCIKNSK